MFGNMQTKGSGEKGLVLPAIFSYIVTLFWLALPSLQLTGSREYWTPPLALLAKHANLITVCRSFYMTNFTGSAYNSGSTSSCVQLFTGVSSARLHHIWSTSASHCPTLPVDNTYDLQQSPTLCTALSSHDVWPSGLLCCWPDGLEHPATQPSRSGIATTYFQSWTENSAALILLAYQCIRGPATMRYINLRLTMTLTLK